MTTRFTERGVLSTSFHRTVVAAIGDLKLRGPRTADFVIGLCRRFPLFVAELGNRHSDRPAL
jgi:hypothetical protein